MGSSKRSTARGVRRLEERLKCVEGLRGSPARADLVVIDLERPSIQGWEVKTLAEALVTGADNGVVRGTYVGGNWKESRS
jgi:hypothetical protein